MFAEFVASITISIIIGIISSLYLSLFEGLIFGTAFFIAWRIIFIWYKYEKTLTALEEQTVIRANRERIKESFLDTTCVFEDVSDLYKKSNPFIVNLYSRKLDSINSVLHDIKKDGCFEFETDVFRRFPDILFTPPTDKDLKEKTNHFYAIGSCGESTKWFTSAEGDAYITHIHESIKGKENPENGKDKENKVSVDKNWKIKRIFICDDNNTELSDEDNICIQLYLNSGHEIRTIARRKIKAFFDGTGDYPIKNDFAVYRKNFAWEKTPQQGELKRGKMSVRTDRIEKYIFVFNAAWARAISLDRVDSKYYEHCKGKDIRDLHEMLEKWAKENCPKKCQPVNPASATTATTSNTTPNISTT
jgi:hypothetical protein